MNVMTKYTVARLVVPCDQTWNLSKGFMIIKDTSLSKRKDVLH